MRSILLNQFKERVKTQPGTVAVDIDGKVLTYQALWKQASRTATLLKQELTSEPVNSNRATNPIVALHLNKSSEFVIAQLACWLAGAAFLPLDIEWPLKRKQLAIREAGCSLVICSDNQHTFSVVGDSDNTQCIRDNGILLYPCPKRNKNTVARFSKPSLIDKAEELAYVIFTSGSSGKPKSVAVSFSGLPAIFQQQIAFIHLKPFNRILWLHHICFDASIADLWVTLLAGGTLVADTRLNPLDILVFIAEHHIHYVDLPASLLRLLSPADIPAHLKTVLVGGEVIDPKVLRQWHKKTRIVMAYGPSEASICTSMYEFKGTESLSGYIGNPIDGIEYRIERAKADDHEENPIGELIVVGPGVALGYLSAKPEDNARFFERNQQRAYRTGDLVQKTEGTYRFVGRVDRQFKLNGKLLCPEEVEQALLQHPKVSQAYVFLNKTQKQSEYTVALSSSLLKNVTSAVVFQQAVSQAIQTELKDWLRIHMPAWMCTPKWVFLNTLPVNANGKIDQAALIEICNQQVASVKANNTRGLKSHIQKYTVAPVDAAMLIKDLPLDSLQWLQVLLALRNEGIAVNSQNLYNLLNSPNATLGELERALLNASNGDFNGKHSTELQGLLSKYTKVCLPNHHHRYGAPGAILLTGATGYLGRLLLSQFAKLKRKVFCLVRKESPLLNNLKESFIHELQSGQFELVYGDIAKQQLGLGFDKWDALAQDVTDVYHCAADTNVLKPLQELIAPNVEGSYQILTFCANKQPKKLHYASTLALVVDSSWKEKPVDESNKLTSGYFYGGYTQSKWLAEQLIQQYPFANIFRFGLLVGRPTQVKSLQSDLFNIRLKRLPQTMNVPDKACVDFTPGHQAANLMCVISQNHSSGIYHIHNPNPIRASLINNILKAHHADYSKWENENHQDPLRIYKMTGVQIRSDITARLVSELGETMPNATTEYINDYIKAIRT